MRKVLLSLGGALLLLAAVFLVMDYREKAASRPRYAFDTAQAADVVSLRAAYQQDSAALIRSGGRWRDASDSFPGDTARIAAALGRLFRLQNRERVSHSADSARLAEYGLDAGEAKRVEWTLADGKRFAVLLGKTSGTDYNSTYWKFGDEPGVYRTPGNFTHDISVRPPDWRDRSLFPSFRHEDVRSVEAEWRDAAGKKTRYKLDRAGDTAFALVEPREAPVPRANAIGIYERTPQLVVDEFVEPGDPNLPAVGLDSPEVVVRITLKDGAVRELTVGRDFDGRHHYARHPTVPGNVFKIATWRMDFFRKTIDEILAPPPPEASGVFPETLEPGHGPGDGHGH